MSFDRRMGFAWLGLSLCEFAASVACGPGVIAFGLAVFALIALRAAEYHFCRPSPESRDG